MKGIILAGGSGTRLYPLTHAISKQILPVYDKPMIYYPLSVLMLAGIREIQIISTPRDIGFFINLFGTGAHLGLSLSYAIQEEPKGIAHSFIITEEFIGSDSVALVLGDNIFYGQTFGQMLTRASSRTEGATIFGYYVKSPESYGIIEFDENMRAKRIVEKPKETNSHYAVVGLYFYDNEVVSIAKQLKPSARGELEITDINNIYLENGKLHYEIMGRGMAWLDAGTHQNLINASNYVQTLQERQGMYIACIEEIAYRKGFINDLQLEKLAKQYEKSDYGRYLYDILENKFQVGAEPKLIDIGSKTT